jgi:Ca2+-binding EF-hand superfamily protein
MKKQFLLRDDQRREIKEAFDVFDAEGNGLIHVKDLRVALRALGLEPRKEELKKLTEDIERKNHASGRPVGSVDFNDFLSVLLEKMGERDSKDQIASAFSLFQPTKGGVIGLAELRRVCQDIGEHLTDEELLEMIKEADVDNDGSVNEEEFLRILS